MELRRQVQRTPNPSLRNPLSYSQPNRLLSPPLLRQAQGRLFDNLDMIAMLAAVRMFLPDRFGRPFERSHSTLGRLPTNAGNLRSGGKGHRK